MSIESVMPLGFSRPKVKEPPYEKPQSNEIVIENCAVAINLVDWKMQDHNIFIEAYLRNFGCDVAGVVEESGSDVKVFQKGDRVIGNTPCLTLGPRYAAFQSYVLCPANVACKIPTTVSLQETSVLPLAINTAGLGLFGNEHLNLPTPSSISSPLSSKNTIFIYGGSTSVGATAIHLAKTAGLRVVTVASKPNHDLCKTLGVDSVFDYKDADGIEQAPAVLLKGGQKQRQQQIVGAFDCISSDTTQKATAKLLGQAGSPNSLS